MGAVGEPLAPMTALTIDIGRKLYPAKGKTAPHLAIEGLHLTIDANELVCFLGPSGCGKTTLLNIVAGLDRDFEGEIRINQSAEHSLACMFQNPRLLPWRTVIENVVLVTNGAPEAVDRARHILAEVGLSGFEHAYPGQLSVGMQRRAALARAFTTMPSILIMDEPFVSLDEPNAEKLRTLLETLRQDHPATILFVTHDLREALRLGDRIVLLSSPPARVLHEARNPLSPAQRRQPSAYALPLSGFPQHFHECIFRLDKDYTKDRGT